MGVQSTNLARVCTAKWQPLWVNKGPHKYCQVFVSPYNGETTYFYDGEWVAITEETLLVYEGSNFREYNESTDGYKVQYSNKTVEEQPEPPVPTNYTVTIVVSPEGAGSVDTSEVTVAGGTLISSEGNILSIGENVEVTATAETGYEFSSWGELPETVTEDLTITATFVATAIPVTAVTIEEGTTVTTEINSNVTLSLDVTPGNANDVSTLSATVSDDTKCSVNIFYQEGNGVRCMIIGLAEGTADVTIYCSGVSQGVIGVTVTAPL